MVILDRMVLSREWILDVLSGARHGQALNVSRSHVVESEYDSGEALAAQLRSAMNRLKVEGFASAGDAVHYARLRDSVAYADYRILSQSLVRFDPCSLATSAARLAFWINLYNALIVDAVIARDIAHSVAAGPLGVVTFFRRAAYVVGGFRVSAEDIEHGILRANRGNPYVPGPHFATHDPRAAWGLQQLDPRVHFALNCASQSCPPIAIYDAQRIDTQLDLAARNFVNQTTLVDDQRGQLCVSRLFQWFAADFGGQTGVIDFLKQYLSPGFERAWLEAQGSAVKLVYDRYDWSLNATRGLQGGGSV